MTKVTSRHKSVNISKTKKDIPKKKTPLNSTLQSLSNKQQKFVNAICTLKPCKLRSHMLNLYIDKTKKKFRVHFKKLLFYNYFFLTSTIVNIEYFDQILSY